MSLVLAIAMLRKGEDDKRIWPISTSRWNNAIVNNIELPRCDEIDPKDQNDEWVVMYGYLDQRDKLIVLPCEKNQLCGNGYGSIQAPAQLTFQHYSSVRICEKQ